MEREVFEKLANGEEVLGKIQQDSLDNFYWTWKPVEASLNGSMGSKGHHYRYAVLLKNGQLLMGCPAQKDIEYDNQPPITAEGQMIGEWLRSLGVAESDVSAIYEYRREYQSWEEEFSPSYDTTDLIFYTRENND